MPTASRDVFEPLRSATAQSVSASAPIRSLAKMFQLNPEYLASESPLIVLKNLQASTQSNQYQIDPSDTTSAMNVANQLMRDLVIHNIQGVDSDNINKFITSLRQIGAPCAPGEKPTGVLIHNISESISGQISQYTNAINASYDPITDSFQQNPLGILQVIVPDGDNYNALTGDHIRHSLKPIFDSIENSQRLIDAARARIGDDELLTNFLNEEQRKLSSAERIFTNYQDKTIQNLPNLVADYVNALQRVDDMMQRSFDDRTRAANLSPNGLDAFDELGIQVITGGIPNKDFEVTSQVRRTNSAGITNTDNGPRDVVFSHISYQELMDKLDTMRADLKLVQQNASTQVSNKIEKQLTLIENLQLQFQDEPSFQIAMQDAARAVLITREELKTIDKSIEAAADEPNWVVLESLIDHLAKKKESIEDYKKRIEAKGQTADSEYVALDKYEKMIKAHGHWFGLYSYFDRNHAAGVTNQEIEEGYLNRLRNLSSPSAKLLLKQPGDAHDDVQYNLIVEKLDNARSILINRDSRANYDDACLKRKQNMQRIFQKIETIDQMSKAGKARAESRDQLLKQGNMSGWERRLNSVSWDKVATSKSGQWTLLSSRLLAQTTTAPALVIGGSVLFVTGSGLAPIFLTAAALSAFSEYKLGISPVNFVDRQIEGIYGRAKLYLDTSYTTAIEADMRGYLKLSQRTDRMEAILIQYVDDFKEQLGADTVQEILFEIIRTKTHLRFDQGVFGSKEEQSAKLSMDINQTQERKTLHSLRMQLILGDKFPPESALQVFPDGKDMNEMIANNNKQSSRITEKEWRQITLEDPTFAEKFDSLDKIKNRLKQPTDIFSFKEDFMQFPLGPIGTLPYIKNALSDASLELNAKDAHSLKRDVMNLFQVIELGHRLSNAYNYQLGVIAENQANSLIDKNIQGCGYKEFSQKVLRKQSAGLSAAIKDKTRSKKSSKGGQE